jgi:hypothetical protein
LLLPRPFTFSKLLNCRLVGAAAVVVCIDSVSFCGNVAGVVVVVNTLNGGGCEGVITVDVCMGKSGILQPEQPVTN